MADALQDAPWATGGDALPDAPWGDVPVRAEKPKDQTTFGGHMTAAVTDVWPEIKNAAGSAIGTMSEAFNPYDPKHPANQPRNPNPSFGDRVSENFGRMGQVGRGIMAVPELIASPITGAARSLIGHPYATLPGMDYEKAKEGVDLAMMGMRPSRGGTRQAPTVAPPLDPPFGVTLSEGQATGDLPAIRREQAAFREQHGKPAAQRATEFFEQQKDQVGQSRENVSRQFDPFGSVIAESPQEAGSVVSGAVRKEAANRKAGVTDAYEYARSLPGEIHAGAFEGIAQKIKSDLSLSDTPVIIDDRTTPFAARALDDIEKTIDRLKIPNKADPNGPPNPENITGVNLKGVEQIRKRLVTFRNDAWKSNPSDGRAASAIVDAFDSRVDGAINSGLFNGDSRAINAWKDARTAHSDFKSTFGGKPNDPVGRVVEKILGKKGNEAAIPNDVADFIYGSAGTNPNSLNVGVAKRIRGILGEQSPEWSAVRQGMFQRLVESGQGVTDFGPGKVAQRLNKFLNVDGREMSHVLYSPQERNMLQGYAEMMRKLEIPATGANRSETAGFLTKALRGMGNKIGILAGATIGHFLVPGSFGLGEGIGAAIGASTGAVGNRMTARKIAKQMPLVGEEFAKWQKAANRAANAATVENYANSTQTKKALAFATANLGRVLEPLGINMENLGKMQGTVSAPAEGDQSQ